MQSSTEQTAENASSQKLFQNANELDAKANNLNNIWEYEEILKILGKF